MNKLLMRRLAHSAFFIINLLCFSSLASANNLSCISLTKQQDAPNIPLQTVTDIIDLQAYQMSRVPGLLVGIVDGKQTALFSCGETAKGNGIRPTGTTVWPIGSVSKVITTTILAQMVVAGKVALTDPVQKYMPADVTIPQFNNRAITLLDLATHTASLPRQLPGLNESDDYQLNDPYAAPAFFKFINSYKLTVMPGTHYDYSNVGFGLLGYALAQRENTTYDQLVANYINKQLGMVDTTTTPSAAQEQREAKSYWMNGVLIKKDWPFNFERPSGGVYSTGNDLLKFMEYSLNESTANAYAANEIAHATYVYRDELDDPLNLPVDGMALGWEVDSANPGLPTLLAKNGWVSGFNTWVILMPSKNIGIFSITNQPYLVIDSTLKGVLRALLQNQQKT